MATNAIYNYMKEQNRPFSVNDIVTNLHNNYNKQEVQKSLEKLMSGQKVFEKIYGKQKIYCIVQETKYDTDELMRIDRELQAHANEVEMKRAEVEKTIRELEMQLRELRANPSLDEALNEEKQLKRRIGEYAKKLDELMEANTGEENIGIGKKRAEEILNEYKRDYNKRKRLCNEIIDCILEAYPGSRKNLYEEIGLDDKIVT